MELLKKHWRSIAIAIVILLLGVLFGSLFRCGHSPDMSLQTSIDSLKQVNVSQQEGYRLIYDSIGKVIESKDNTNKALNSVLSDITAKYVRLRNSTPNVDTVVKVHEVFVGQECLEKLPVLECKVINLESEVTDMKNLVKTKTDNLIALQGQFDRAMAITDNQQDAIKKLERKRRANKAWAVIATAGAGAAVIAVMVVH